MIDLWRGVLLCDMLDKDPVLRLLQWPVPPPQNVCIEMYNARSIRDATLSNGVVRFVEVTFDDNGDAGCSWTATIWRREISSEYWFECFEVDIANILANDSSFSHLLCKVWGDEVNKQGLNKVICASPTLSLSSDDVVYFMTREAKVEAVEVVSFELSFSPCAFSSFNRARPGALPAGVFS